MEDPHFLLQLSRAHACFELSDHPKLSFSCHSRGRRQGHPDWGSLGMLDDWRHTFLIGKGEACRHYSDHGIRIAVQFYGPAHDVRIATKADFHKRLLKTATCSQPGWSSDALNVRPSSGETPRVGKNPAETRAPSRRSGGSDAGEIEGLFLERTQILKCRRFLANRRNSDGHQGMLSVPKIDPPAQLATASQPGWRLDTATVAAELYPQDYR